MTSSQLLAFNQRSAATGVALWPAVVLIAGVEYDATLPQPRGFSGELIGGGEQVSGILTARVTKSQLVTAPAPYQDLKWKRPGAATWDTTTWWIEEVTGPPADAEWRITCSPKN